MKSILDKKGGKMGAGTVWGVFFAAVVVILLIIWGFGGFTQQTAIPLDDEGNPVISVSDCPESTQTITFSAVDALSQNTAVSSDIVVKRGDGKNVNGSVVTGYTVDEELQILYRAGDYINDDQTYTVKCGDTAAPTMELFATNTQTISIKNDADTAVLSDNAAGDSVNETIKGAGAAYNWEVSITGTDKQSSGDLVYVVEISIPANVSSITMSGSNGALTKLDSVPNGLTISGTNQERVAFEIPAIVGAVKEKFNLQVAATSGKTVSGAVYTTAYSEQGYVEVNGNIEKGVVDSDGTVVYEDTYDYDFLIE